MNPESIHQIDQLLEALENTDVEQLPNMLPNFLNSVCDAVNLPHDALFETNEPTQKKFIAVCLLRLLCRNGDAILQHADFRTKTCNLFDNQISSIYDKLEITENDQNHEKMEKLIGTEQSVLDKFGALTDSIVTLEMVPQIRSRFMRTLNFQANKLFLEQFVTPSSLISNAHIDQIFKTAGEYIESSMEDRVASYQTIETVFNSFLDDARKNPSIFTEQCIVAPVEKIYNCIRNDFENNGVIQPTTVAISPLDRKYPFHVIDEKVELKFRVENQGVGYAFGVQIEFELEEGLTPCNPVNLGNLAPGQSSEIILETTVKDQIESPYVMGSISWQNFNKSEETCEFDYHLIPQRTDLNWNELRLKQPYSLEAIQEAKDLVGRLGLMGQLNTRLAHKQIGSSFIHGQKRVGKTSIASAVQESFNKNENYLVVFIPITSLDTTTPDRLVADLGKTIVDEVSDTSQLFSHIKVPQFESALAPLRDYFRVAKTISPDHKFIIILDEFDEIHPDMVQINSDVGQTFFNNIRGLSSTGYVGFVLVGGENMQVIIESTDQLNRMTSFRVDYFDKNRYWDDFQELVRRPVKGSIEFNDEAINALYEMTEGHPYYTKAICSEIYTAACEARSPYISEDNVEKAVEVTIESLDPNAFSHFWIDGISKRYTPAQRDEIQTQRRKFLIAFAQIKRKKASVNKQDLQNSALLGGIDVDKIIDQYRTRGFLIEEQNHYRWKPKIFELWLTERGFQLLTGEFLNEEAIINLKKEEEASHVEAGEIRELRSKWGLYQGSQITSDDVRAWLKQFEYKTEQRLMFNLLEHVHFYSEAMIRERFRVLHNTVQRDVAARGGIISGDRRQRRNDILLSSFGPPSKSGSSYARLYAQENNIYVDNAISFDHIERALEKNPLIKAIVFVDDIIGSGSSSIESLDELNRMFGDLISRKQVTVFIAAICGLQTGVEKLTDVIDKVPFDVQVIVSDLLTEADQCFSNQSEVFSSSDERDQAKRIASEYGRQLDKNQPVGYDDSQLLVVFRDNCPNNTLPILWKESTGQMKWTPLFKRS